MARFIPTELSPLRPIEDIRCDECGELYPDHPHFPACPYCVPDPPCEFCGQPIEPGTPLDVIWHAHRRCPR